MRLVLDTSLFVNPACAQAFGPFPTAAFAAFLELAKDSQGVECCMPPSIYAELMHFVEEQKIPKSLLLVLNTKPPRKHETKIPGIFIYELVETMRDRVDRGLRLAERHVREALHMEPPPKVSDHGSKAVRADAEAIARLRESYRRIMREGLLDSRADVDLLLLAYELDATLVSADQGVIDWAEKLGIRLLPYERLRALLIESASQKV